jgi:hypothetical protein
MSASINGLCDTFLSKFENVHYTKNLYQPQKNREINIFEKK